MTDTAAASQIRFDLLRTLHAFVMGMPEEQFNLNSIVEDLGDEGLLGAGAYKECGTIACGMGWASLLPEFNKLGLRWDRLAGNLKLHGKTESYDDAATKLFNLPPYKDVWGPDEEDFKMKPDHYAHMLFAPYDDDDLDGELIGLIRESGRDSISHRLLLDARMRHFFGLFGQSL